MTLFRNPSSTAAPAPQGEGCGRSAAGVVFDAFVSQVYLPHARARKRSWRVDERIARRYLSPAFGMRPLAALSRGEVERWLEGLSGRNLAPATCNRILAVLKSVCSLAAIHGLVAGQSLCAGVPFFKVRLQRERYLTREEARRLMRALERSDRPEAAALRLLLLTGARKSEILGLRWENIRLDLRLLTVPLSKSGRPRHIPLSEAAAAVIRSLPRMEGNPWLFPGHAPGRPLSDVYLFWNRLRRSLGLKDVRVHDLRHTFASFLVNAGHSLYEVQKLLGHSDPRTTTRYAHLGHALLVAATETVSGLLLSGKRRTAPFRRPAGRERRADGGGCRGAGLRQAERAEKEELRMKVDARERVATPEPRPVNRAFIDRRTVGERKRPTRRGKSNNMK